MYVHMYSEFSASMNCTNTQCQLSECVSPPPPPLQGEMGWRKEPVNVWDWVDQYWMRRYGSTSAVMTDAWYHLLESVYHFDFSWNLKSLIEKAPEFDMP